MTAEQRLLLETLATEAALVVTCVEQDQNARGTSRYEDDALVHAKRVRDALNGLVTKTK
jgi:hypothetical protein